MSIFKSTKNDSEQNIDQQIELFFENAVKEAINNNPLKGTQYEGVKLFSEIGIIAENIKKDIYRGKYNIKLNYEDIQLLVDEITKKIIDKYFYS